MPVSKNKRRSKRGRRRKENLAKVGGAFGGRGTSDRFNPPPRQTPPTSQPDAGSQEQTPEENAGTR